jgi:ligand-binding sensor domain-containing protein/signal transduction histidine kinase
MAKRYVNKCCYFLLLPVLLAAGSRLSGQPAMQPRPLNTADGLVNDVVQSIAQDRQGFLWVGTQDGLSRYDGSSFRTYRADARRPGSLVSNFVRAVAADPGRGGVWVGTGSGLCYYNPRTEQFEPVAMNAPGDTYFVHAVLVDKSGRVWLGTEDGLWRYSPGTRQLQRLSGPAGSARQNSIRALVQDAAGVVWVGTGAGALLRYDPLHRNLRYDARYGPPGAAPLSALAANAQGLWVGTEAGSLRYLPAAGPAVDMLPPQPGQAAVRSLWANAAGAWVGTAATLRYWPLPGLGQPAPIALSEAVQALRPDRAGQLWLGTESGLHRLDIRPSAFRQPLPGAATGAVWAVETTKTAVWLGTEQLGLLRLHPRTGAVAEHLRHRATDTTSLADNYVRALLATPDGGLWVGTQRHGLDYRPAGAAGFRHFRHRPGQAGSLADDFVRCVYRDPLDGSLWVGTEGGLCHLADARTGRFVTYRHQPGVATSLPSNYVRCVRRDPAGYLWVATGGGGLCRLDAWHPGRFITYRADAQNERSLPSNFVRSLAFDAQGRLWIGTEGGGLCRLDDAVRGRFTTFGEDQGLLSELVYGLVADSATGTLWASTNRGLARLEPRTGRLTTFDARDGLPQDDYNAGAAASGPGGQLFFGGPTGLVSFRPAGLPLPPRPKVLLTGLRRFNRPVVLPDTALGQRRLLRLGPQDYVFSLEFAALDLRRAGRYPLLYRLEGFDREWLAAGPGREATYTNLDPGHYTFRVRGADAPAGSGAVLRLVVEPAWYRTWWFRLAVGLLVAGLGWLAYRLRVRQLLALEQVRHRIARDLHDDMGSTLSNISILSQLAHNHQQAERPAQAAALLVQIGDSSRRMLDSMDDIVWAINPAHDGLADVSARMLAFASEVLEAQGVELHFEMTAAVESLRLPMEARREFFLLFKEAVNNLAKYAQARHATIGLSYAQRHLHLLIQDDGVGFDPAAPARGGGNGMANMRARAATLGGQLEVTSAPGRGTTLRLRLPLG